MKSPTQRSCVLASALATLLTPAAVHGGNVPYLVKDIKPGPLGSSPSFLSSVGGRLFFNADDGVHGQELWISDGTEQGTYLVIDLVPGADGSVPQQIVELNGKALFQVDDNVDGMQWFISDGTAAGTLSVADVEEDGPGIAPNVCGFWGIEAVTVGSVVFFEGDDPAHGKELWKTDGTPGGTQLVKEVRLGPSDGFLQTLRRVDSQVYFAALSAPQVVAGNDPWRSDGTNAGTVMLADLSGAIEFTGADGLGFFRGEDAAAGEELWVSDGTPEGTRMVKDINPGINPSSPFDLVDVNGILYFRAFSPKYSREIWRSDGTEEGTYLVADINPAGTSGTSLLTNVDGTLFFRRNGPTNWELWKSDGTAKGTVLVKSIGPDTAGDMDWLTPLNGKLYFSADDGVHGRELWVSDGTTEGTFMIADTNPGLAATHPSQIVAVGSLIFFVGGAQGFGGELWAYETRQQIPAMSADGFLVLGVGIMIAAAILIHRNREQWSSHKEDL